MNNDGQNHATWQDVKNAYRIAIGAMLYQEGSYEARRLCARWRPVLAGLHEAALIVAMFACAAVIGWLAATAGYVAASL